MLGLLTTVPIDQVRQGHVVRNIAELVDRIPSDGTTLGSDLPP
jgi:integrase